jgi:hypothetical protein
VRIFGPGGNEVTGDGDSCIMRSVTAALLTKYNWNDNVKEDEMEAAYSTNGC